MMLTHRSLYATMIGSFLPLLIVLLQCVDTQDITTASKGPFRWMKRDNFDKIMEDMFRVNENNCQGQHVSRLRLPYDAISDLPAFNILPSVIIYQNRTNLLHLHNMALNRAYYYSYILQRLNESRSDFVDLPGFQYYYFSASADVSANPGLINGSAALFDTNCTYPNWYITGLDFNRTLPLFGPYAWRLDDYNDEMNWLREPTNQTIFNTDLGAGLENNYTSTSYKNNAWLKDDASGLNYIPDFRRNSAEKHQYSVEITHANEQLMLSQVPDVKRKFFGPPSPGQGESELPVRFTRPYYDCGRSKKWIVSAVAPIIDYMPRYSPFVHLRYQRTVGISIMDIDFLHIDFDPCERSDKLSRHMFSGIARCKDTTLCEPLPGFGFKRGGYMCHCRPGYRYPFMQNGPFMGVDIEQATEAEYNNGFDCLKIGWRQEQPTEKGIGGEIASPTRRRRRRSYEEIVLAALKGSSTAPRKIAEQQAEPTFLLQVGYLVNHHWTRFRTSLTGLMSNCWQKLGSSTNKDLNTSEKNNSSDLKFKPTRLISNSQQSFQSAEEEEYKSKSRQRLIARHKRALDYRGRLSSFDPNRFEQVTALFNFLPTVSAENCMYKKKEELVFPGEVGYGASKQFAGQARTALRLAHFLSAFLQNSNLDERYGNIRGDRRLNRHQVFGEVFANVMADSSIETSGVYFDRDSFIEVVNSETVKREWFAPLAYRNREQNNKAVSGYQAIDAAGSKTKYWTQSWFLNEKERWASNTYGLERFIDKPFVRSDVEGSQLRKYDNYPLYYRAPRYEEGYWSEPYFDCGGQVNDWVVTYSAPFFGRSETARTLQFMGVVTTTVLLRRLDTDQCPSSFYTPNFFKSTARCDYESTYCALITGRDFKSGGYKCECRQGYEYPFNDQQAWFFDGQTMEQEWMKKQAGQPNRFDILKCREAGAAALVPSVLAVTVSLLIMLRNVVADST